MLAVTRHSDCITTDASSNVLTWGCASCGSSELTTTGTYAAAANVDQSAFAVTSDGDYYSAPVPNPASATVRLRCLRAECSHGRAC